MSYDLDNTDKLSIFVDDARRLDVAVLGPCINHSEASFSVEVASSESALAVRYGLGGLKGVGENAMEQLVAEREANGAFVSLDEFADRIDPKLLNRRQIEALAAGGAFDVLGIDKASAFAGAETIMATASRSAAERVSGQGGLFGGDVDTAPSLQLPRADAWSLAQSMAAEKDVFGFYFSAHPVSHYQALTDGMRARSYGEVAAWSPAPPGERRPATMAALIESVKPRTSQRGNRYLQLSLSDRSGQFPASCFDESTCKLLEELANAGGCALLNVEMDWREGEEAPRIAVRGVQPLEAIMATAPLRLLTVVDSAEALAPLAELLAECGPGNGEILVGLSEGGPDAVVATLRLPQRRAIDQERVHRIERLAGVAHVALTMGNGGARAASGTNGGSRPAMGRRH